MSFSLGPIQKKWLEALRSGDYKQGKRYLNQGNEKFCCLGVLCEVMGLKKKEIGNGRFAYSENGTTWSEEVIPNNKAMQLAGLRGFEGQPEIPGPVKALTFYNDEGGKTFEEIADIIEANADKYFTESK